LPSQETWHHPLSTDCASTSTLDSTQPRRRLSAGIDLALAWVEDDCGTRAAVAAARELVLFLRRPANQTQLSVTLAAQAAESRPIQELQVWIADNLRRDLSTTILAQRVSARYVLHLRVEAARRLLASTPHDLKRVAAAVGFGNADVMRRAFLRVLGTPPAQHAPGIVAPRRV
jgi:transcriptional regulator GlxA family with amidase domain